MCVDCAVCTVGTVNLESTVQYEPNVYIGVFNYFKVEKEILLLKKKDF